MVGVHGCAFQTGRSMTRNRPKIHEEGQRTADPKAPAQKAGTGNPTHSKAALQTRHDVDALLQPPCFVMFLLSSGLSLVACILQAVTRQISPS